MLGHLLQRTICLSSRHRLHHAYSRLKLFTPQKVMWKTAPVQCVSFHDAGLKRLRDEYPRKPGRSSNKEPLSRRRTWNVSSTAVHKLRRDVMWGKGYSLFSYPKKGEGVPGVKGLVNVSKLFSEENYLDDTKLSLKTLSNYDLRCLLTKLAMSRTSSDLLKRLKLLEGQCCERLKTLSMEDRLYIADVFFMAGFPSARYYEQLFSTIYMEWNDSKEMTKQQVVQLLFYIGVYRNSPVQLMDYIEEFLHRNVKAFSGPELGLICNAFFASNRSIRNADLLEGISLSVLNAEEMPFYLIANVLKVFRHAQFTNLSFYETIGNKLSNPIPHHTSLVTLASIISSYSSVRIKHTSLFENFGKVVDDGICNKDKIHGNIRMKDLARMLWAFCNLQESPPQSFVWHLVEGLRVVPGLTQMYPGMYVEAMVGMAMAGTYPHDLLDDFFSPAFVGNVKARLLDQKHQMRLVDTAVGVEEPNYDGNRLSEDSFGASDEEWSNQISVELHARKGLASTWWTLRQLMGDPAKVRCHHICKFSHIADLEIWLDENNRPLHIPAGSGSSNTESHLDLCERRATGKIQTKWTGTDKKENTVIKQLCQEESVPYDRLTDRIEPEPLYLKPKEQLVGVLGNASKRRVVIKVMGWNQYALNAPFLMGIPRMELRLLAGMGYEVFVVNPAKATELERMPLELRESFVLEHVLHPLNVNLQ